MIGSPECRAFSSLQNINARTQEGKMKLEAKVREATKHLYVCTEVYKMQMAAGRYFLHEHPKTATSWVVPCIKGLLGNSQVMTTEIDQCAYGLFSEDEHGKAPAKKANQVHDE